MLTTAHLNDLSNTDLLREVFGKDRSLWNAFMWGTMTSAWKALIDGSRFRGATDAIHRTGYGDLRTLMGMSSRPEYWGVAHIDVERAANILRRNFIEYEHRATPQETLANAIIAIAYEGEEPVNELRSDSGEGIPLSDLALCMFNDEEEHFCFHFGDLREYFEEAAELYATTEPEYRQEQGYDERD